MFFPIGSKMGQKRGSCGPSLSRPEHTMRLFITVMSLFAFAVPAAAQSWREYSYPDHSFSVSFPAAPRIGTATFKVADDRAVEAHIYSVRRDDAEFKVTVA